MIYIIRAKDKTYWQEIARRAGLEDKVSGALVDTGDSQTILALSQNDQASFGRDIAQRISAFAVEQKAEHIAESLLRRSDLDRGVVSFLYQAVGQSLQFYIKQHFPDYVEEGLAMVDEICFEDIGYDDVASMDAEKSSVPNMPKGDVSVANAVRLLERGRHYEFIQAFARFSQISPAIVEKMLHQKTGQGLAIVCKSLCVTQRDFMLLFMLSFRFASQSRMIDPGLLKRASAYYERMDRRSAQMVLEKSAKAKSLFRSDVLLTYAHNAATPGKVLPSIHSRKAPPAVEI